MKWFIKKHQFFKDVPDKIMKSSTLFDVGWGNGYVIIPSTHPWHMVHHENLPVDVHGGLTFGCFITKITVDFWEDPNLTSEDIGNKLIGFDTAHYQDDIKKWPEEAVILETIHLAEQVLARSKEKFKYLF